MNDPIDHRVTRLEYRVDGHDQDLTSIKGDTKLMSKTLEAIQNNLNQIKWIAVGAALAFLAQTEGVHTAILKVLF
jgi:hypothetical protein